MKKIKWGILGCGKIARKFAADLKLVEGADLVAVASRDDRRGHEFAALFNVPIVMSTYEALAMSDSVDVIYIATPHGFHCEHALLCLRNKKAVLCEKAYGLNAREVRAMISTARENGVFLMEAFWTKFLPQFEKVRELIASGTIGNIKMIQADFGFRAATPTPQRLHDPALGGGVLLDIGIYPVFLAISLLGRPVEVHAVMTPYPSGVDEQIVMALKFNAGQLATLSASFAAETPVEATIIGTNGYLRLHNRFHNATALIDLKVPDQQEQRIVVPKEEGYGYQYEARHVTECLQQGLAESTVMTHDDSMLLIETLDRIRERCGITYAADQI
jgi:predicted dehydrogenase